MSGFKLPTVYPSGEGDIIYHKQGSKSNKGGNGFGLSGFMTVKSVSL